MVRWVAAVISIVPLLVAAQVSVPPLTVSAPAHPIAYFSLPPSILPVFAVLVSVTVKLPAFVT
ncbi:MAG: hypothetical protein ACLR0P_10470 [Oscillospiraceae bacterium]